MTVPALLAPSPQVMMIEPRPLVKSAAVAMGLASFKVATWKVNWAPSVPVTSRPVRVKGASVTVKSTGPAVPPPGGGLTTVTSLVASSARLEEGTAADSCMLLTKVVAKFAPFHWTTEVRMKFVPLTMRGKPALPSTAVVWLNMLMVGAGLLTVVAATGLVLTTTDPVKLTEYSVVLSAVALPLTYFPVLVVANDRSYLGDDINPRWVNALAVVFLVLIVAASIAALPLLFATKAGL